jgi:uncharacterized membrane protein (UPF0127 family)
MIVRNVSSGSIVASRVARASNPWTRGLGLLPRKAVAPDEGLWIDGCSAVHTMGMRATLDLFFLDKRGHVLKIACAVPPFRAVVACRNAVTVVELGAETGNGRDVLVGDRLALE